MDRTNVIPSKKLISFTELSQMPTKLSRILDESHFRNLQNSFLQPFPICFKHQFEVVLTSWAPMASSSETSPVPREHSPSLGTWTRAHRISCRGCSLKKPFLSSYLDGSCMVLSPGGPSVDHFGGGEYFGVPTFWHANVQKLQRSRDWICGCQIQIRPHRFGGEGVLIGGQTATLNAQSHLLI